MRSSLTIDIWFLFGSFAYGVEGRIVACGENFLKIEPLVTDKNDFTPLMDFFEDLALRPKGLVRTEVRIFDECQRPEFPISLLTELAPEVQCINGSEFYLGLSHIRGLTPRDADNWRKLVCEMLTGFGKLEFQTNS